MTIQAPNQTVKAALEDRHLSVLRDLIGQHVGEQLQVRVTLNPHAQIEPTAAAPRSIPQRRRCHRHMPLKTQNSKQNSQPPAWISAERWAELPAMLRAALVGSQLVNGAVRGRDAFVTRLLETRHQREVEGSHGRKGLGCAAR